MFGNVCQRRAMGSVFAASSLLERLRTRLGPWTIYGPSRDLSDRDGQIEMRSFLLGTGRRLANLVAAAIDLEVEQARPSMVITSNQR